MKTETRKNLQTTRQKPSTMRRCLSAGFILSDLSGCFAAAYIGPPTQQKAEGHLQDLASVCIVCTAFPRACKSSPDTKYTFFFNHKMVLRFSLELHQKKLLCIIKSFMLGLHEIVVTKSVHCSPRNDMPYLSFITFQKVIWPLMEA